jgi:serine/threonine-protein kinase HipA
MRHRVRATWYDVAGAAGVSEKDCERIAGAFVYPGFDLEQVQWVDRD